MSGRLGRITLQQTRAILEKRLGQTWEHLAPQEKTLREMSSPNTTRSRGPGGSATRWNEPGSFRERFAFCASPSSTGRNRLGSEKRSARVTVFFSAPPSPRVDRFHARHTKRR